jgi:hypothetical protein
MISRICLACDRANAADAKFCSECGAPLQLKLCRHCHKANDYAAHFCQSCGNSLPHSPTEPGEVQPSTIAEQATVARQEPLPAPSPASEAKSANARPALAMPTIVKAFSPASAATAAPASDAGVSAIDGVTVEATATSVLDAMPPSPYGPPAVVDLPLASEAHRTRTGVRFAGGALLLLGIAAAVLLTIGRSPTAPQQPVEADPRPVAAATGTSAPDASAAMAAPLIPPLAAPAPSDSTEPPTPAPLPEGEAKAPAMTAAMRRPSPTADAAPLHPLPKPTSATVRECTTELAVLGLCALPTHMEGK